MSSKKQAEQLAANLGCIIHHAEQGVVTCEAPAGYCFDQDVHERVYPYEAALLPKSAAWAEMWGDMQDGVELCCIPDCEWCNESGDER